MASTDLESYKVESSGGKMRAAVWTDRVENIRREVSLDAEYQQSPEAAFAVSNRLLIQHDFDTIIYLWDKYGIPYEYNMLIGEVVSNVGKDKKDVFEEARKAKEMIGDIHQHFQKGLTLLKSLERRVEALEAKVGDFRKDERYYATKK